MISPLRSLPILWICVIFTTCTGLLCLGCRDTINVLPSPVPTPTPTTAPVIQNVIQFRVIGNPTSARIRYSTPVDGLGQTVSTLPYFNSLSTSADVMFLSLEATPTSYPGNTIFAFFSVQIVVNDTVFREATSQDFSLGTLSISGTWRR